MTTIKELKNVALRPGQSIPEPEPIPQKARRKIEPKEKEVIPPAPVGNRKLEVETPRPKRPSRLKKLHEFDFMITKENAPRILPFIFFVSLWVILYIANHHYGEKTLLQIDRMHKEMKDLKADFYTTNAELSNKSIQSHVAKMVEPMGLKELTEPAQRIKLNNN